MDVVIFYNDQKNPVEANDYFLGGRNRSTPFHGEL